MNNEENNEEVFVTPMDVLGLKVSEPSLRVRDMINLYNFATEKNQALARAKSLYFADIKAALEQEQEQEQEQQQAQQQEQIEGQVKHTAGCLNCSLQDGSCCCTISSQAARAPSELPAANAEKSYHSQTTIRKTAQGVRIIIDIFFDKSQDIDFVGSRVETDIPESHILAEFQRKAQSMSESTEI